MTQSDKTISELKAKLAASEKIRCEMADQTLAWAQKAKAAEAENEALKARLEGAEEALKEAAAALAIEARANEMSANIMRDRRRTGGWEGAERTAAAFDRHGLKAAGIRAKILAALNAKKGSDL